MYVERVPLESRINIMAVLATPNFYGSAIVDEYASQRSVGVFLFPSHRAGLVKLCVAGCLWCGCRATGCACTSVPHVASVRTSASLNEGQPWLCDSDCHVAKSRPNSVNHCIA